MKPGLSSAWVDALEAAGIRTHWLVRLDFRGETALVWTGPEPLGVMDTGDVELDGRVFQPLDPGIPISLGESSFSYQGSQPLTLACAIKAQPDETLAHAAVDRDEYQGRMAFVWRALLIAPPGPGVPPTWAFRQLRVGSMDEVIVRNSGAGGEHTFSLTIGGHATLMSQASQASWLDQRRFDSADSSQDYAVSIQNGRPMPAAPSHTVTVFGTPITVPGWGGF